MPRRKEVPYSPISTKSVHDQDTLREPRGARVHLERAHTPHEALMRCAPFEDPQPSRAEMLALRETIADAIDTLPERQRWIFNACVIERRAIRAVADDLSLTKSYVHRLLHEARAKLAMRLGEHPQVQEYLNR